MQVQEALQIMQDSLPEPPTSHSVPLARAHGRVLAADQHAVVDCPAADNSARDGYAVRCASVGAAAKKMWPISQYLPAGVGAVALAEGTVARIFTGAALPLGADAIVPQEDAEVHGDRVRFLQLPRAHAHVRPAGGDFRTGKLLYRAGQRLRGVDLGLLAAAGIAEVSVFRTLRVGVLANGDELLAPGAPYAPNRNYDANSPMLTGLLHSLCMEPIAGGIAADEDADIEQRFLELAASADCIVSSGGVSVGTHDRVREVLQKIGSLRLWRIAMRPGQPFAFGMINGCPFFGLPGNPASVFVGFHVLLRPCLLQMQGQSESQRSLPKARAAFSRQGMEREEYLRARLYNGADGEWEVDPDIRQDSGILSSAVAADCLVRVPANRSVIAGDRLQILPLYDSR